MSLEARKLELIEYILQAKSESVLNRVRPIFEDEKNEVVENTIKGEALTKQEYVSEIIEAEKQIEKGTFKSHQEVGKAIKEWR